MGTIVTILLVILGVMLLFAIIEALLWLIGLAILGIAAVVAWRWVSSKLDSVGAGT